MNNTPGWASPGSAPSDRPAPTDGAPATEYGQEPADQGPQPPAEGQPAQQPAPAGSPGHAADAPAHGPTPAAAPPNWSKEQSPPGPWPTPGGGSVPQPPPPPPGPSWGGPPSTGYGHPGWGGWHGAPPAAKPGVIPLRPLGVGEILDGAVSTMRTYWRTVLGISLSVSVLVQVTLVLLRGLVFDVDADLDVLSDRSASLDELRQALRGILISSGMLLLVTLLGMIIATALLTPVISRAVLGKSVTVSEAWREARPQLLRLFGLTFVVPIIVILSVAVGALPGLVIALVGSAGAGVALAVLGELGGMVVALWLGIRFSLASPALMLEKQSVARSLSRSAKLVKGSWWRVLGIQLLAGIITAMVSSIIALPLTFVAGVVDGEGMSGLFGVSTGHSWTYLLITGAGSVIGSMLTLPISAGVTVLLYIDQRIRREALDLELGRAAGVQGYGSEVPRTVPGG